MTDEQRAEYAEAVWSAFLPLAGRKPTSCPSPIEWSLLKQWLDSEIPLRIVLRAFQEAPKPGSTLAYFRRPVAEAAERWRRALA